MDAISPGPWYKNERFNPTGKILVMKPMNPTDPFAQIPGTSNPRDVLCVVVSENREADAEFIAAAPTRIAELEAKLAAVVAWEKKYGYSIHDTNLSGGVSGFQAIWDLSEILGDLTSVK